MDLTEAAYQSVPRGGLDVDRAFCTAIRDRSPQQQRLVEELTVPVRSGRAWVVPAGDVCRVTTIEGPQVADMNFWSLSDPRERMWAARTGQLQAAHVTEFDRLGSTLPFLRPMVTITGDSLREYGEDAESGRVHDLLGPRCHPYVNRMLEGEDFDVHDVLNVFQWTGLNAHDEYFMKTCPAQRGDHVEFFAEFDLLVALSTCPGALSVPMFGENAGDALSVCHPLGVEVFALDEELLEGWDQPHRAAYAGQHGMEGREWIEADRA